MEIEAVKKVIGEEAFNKLLAQARERLSSGMECPGNIVRVPVFTNDFISPKPLPSDLPASTRADAFMFIFTKDWISHTWKLSGVEIN